MSRERIVPCRASCPDPGGAFQWFDEKEQCWRWFLVGCTSWIERTASSVQRQANSESRIPIGARVRFVLVEKWTRHPDGGWRARIYKERTIEVRKTDNSAEKPKCYALRGCRRKP